MEKMNFDPHGERPHIGQMPELGIQPVKSEKGDDNINPLIIDGADLDDLFEPDIIKQIKNPPIIEA